MFEISENVTIVLLTNHGWIQSGGQGSSPPPPENHQNKKKHCQIYLDPL